VKNGCSYVCIAQKLKEQQQDHHDPAAVLLPKNLII